MLIQWLLCMMELMKLMSKIQELELLFKSDGPRLAEGLRLKILFSLIECFNSSKLVLCFQVLRLFSILVALYQGLLQLQLVGIHVSELCVFRFP